ncbi:hypothetical protein B0T22DRAFT_436684 [Podospora appendiculata]|uniref:C2H2-type domain-containing protein n=1 Tax=Podospora appendiculata TaxID=314037 RepID=A0AAE1CGB4_9PEZI|nr:hypothetical protein B0T22DRAFT_436684 [Podospora appendiculata]
MAPAPAFYFKAWGLSLHGRHLVTCLNLSISAAPGQGQSPSFHHRPQAQGQHLETAINHLDHHDLIPEASVHNQTSTALPSNNGPPPQAPTFSFTSDLHVDLVSTFAPEFQNSQADNNDDDTNNVQPASINKTVAETTTNTATKRQTFVCSYSPCDSEPFRNASDLRKHVERKHTRPYICCVCERNFGSKGDLDRHMNSLCPEAVPPGSLKRFMCHDAQCVGREFSRSDNFQEHMKTKHGEQKFNKKKMKKKKKKIEKKEKKTIHE